MNTATPRRKPNECMIPKIRKDITIYRNLFIQLAIIILMGFVFKLIIPISRQWIGKSSIITGILLLRTYFFLPPIILTAILLIQIYNVRVKYRDISDSKYWRKMNAGFVFSNIFYILTFYLIYYKLYKPLFYHNEFKLSGHVLSTLFSGSMTINVRYLSQQLYNRDISKGLMKIISHVSTFLVFHNLYTAIWTVWVFHSLTEAFISYLIAIFYILVIYAIDLDRLILSIINPNIFPEKSRNKINKLKVDK
jgi:hypothetical protein